MDDYRLTMLDEAFMYVCGVGYRLCLAESLNQLTEGSIPIAVAISSYLSSQGCIPEAGCRFKVFWRFLVLHLCEVYIHNNYINCNKVNM